MSPRAASSSVLDGKGDLALAAPDLVHAHLDPVAETVPPTGAAADERRPERVRLEVVAGQAARRQEALEDLAEADEQAGADDADDLALVRALPAALEELRLEKPGEAELVGEVLDLGGLALANRCVLRQRGQVLRRRILGGAQLVQERAVAHEVGVAADRRGEVAVSGGA